MAPHNLGLNGAVVFALSRIIALFLFAMLFMKARKAQKEMASIWKQSAKQDWKATITFFTDPMRNADVREVIREIKAKNNLKALSKNEK